MFAVLDLVLGLVLHRMYAVVSSRPGAYKDMSATICSMFLSRICTDAVQVKASTILVAFDGDEVFRYDLFPDYKAAREAKKCGASPYDYLHDLQSYLDRAGIANVQLKKYEADDVLASLTARYDKVVVTTKDKDAYQYLRPGVMLYDSSFKVKGVNHPRTIKHTDVKSIFGVAPEHCIEYQMLAGDGIDSIKGVVSEAKAAQGLTRWGSIKAWAANDDKFRARVIERKAQLKRNRKLVTLVKDIGVEAPPIKWNPDPKLRLPSSYYALKSLCVPKSKGLF